MTDTEALARLLAWIGRGEGRSVLMRGVPDNYRIRLHYPRSVAGDACQNGCGVGFASAVEDALARAPE